MAMNPRRSEELFVKELPIQRVSGHVEFGEKGMPSCLHLFDLHMMCMGSSFSVTADLF